VAHEWLDRLGLPADCWRRPAAELSVGQQQRVAAARALMGSPEVVIADEPTSALDEDTRDQYMQVLLAACAQAHAALVFVSHDRGLRRHFDRVQRLDAGQLVEAQTGETA
jgi:putative ABC transport system ATP-binding protein